MKTIDTLEDDVNKVLSEGCEVPDNLAKEFGESLSELIGSRLKAYQEPHKPYLRMSAVGKPLRQLWYDLTDEEPAPDVGPTTKTKFLYGDIIEIMMVYLAKVAGHTVSHLQHEVEYDGLSGSIDCMIDGELVDIKSTSKFAFSKFESVETLKENDSFGYIEQIHGYATSLGLSRGFFWAVCKETGRAKLLEVPCDPVAFGKRLNVVRKALDQSRPPEKCFDPVADGKSGNFTLSPTCTYCRHKERCWSDSNGGRGLRAFRYSNGIKYLTHVMKTPNVFEVFLKKEK